MEPEGERSRGILASVARALELGERVWAFTIVGGLIAGAVFLYLLALALS